MEFDDEVAMADLKDRAWCTCRRSGTCLGLFTGRMYVPRCSSWRWTRVAKVLTLQRAERGLEDVFKELTRG